jgi:MoxR-like ATPase
LSEVAVATRESQALDGVASRLRASIASIIRGKDDAIELVLTALLARGHVLVEDVPGVGKTTLAHTLARSINCAFNRVQFTSDLLPSDVLGISIYNQAANGFEFKPGPIFTNVLLADEINRTTPKTQSALLEAMNEEQVTVDNKTYRLPQPFMVIATQNPIEHHGTYPLPESQLDRFLLRIRMGYPAEESEKEIVRQLSTTRKVDALQPVVTGEEIGTIQERVKEVRMDDSLLNYLVAVATKTRNSEYLTLGVSPRGSMALFRAAQARAALHNRDYVTPDDLKSLVIPAFSHRVMVSSRYASTSKKSHQADQILRDLLETIPIPL